MQYKSRNANVVFVAPSKRLCITSEQSPIKFYLNYKSELVNHNVFIKLGMGIANKNCIAIKRVILRCISQYTGTLQPQHYIFLQSQEYERK